jgi:hypothetical protein
MVSMCDLKSSTSRQSSNRSSVLSASTRDHHGERCIGRRMVPVSCQAHAPLAGKCPSHTDIDRSYPHASSAALHKRKAFDLPAQAQPGGSQKVRRAPARPPSVVDRMRWDRRAAKERDAEALAAAAAAQADVRVQKLGRGEFRYSQSRPVELAQLETSPLPAARGFAPQVIKAIPVPNAELHPRRVHVAPPSRGHHQGHSGALGPTTHAGHAGFPGGVGDSRGHQEARSGGDGAGSEAGRGGSGDSRRVSWGPQSNQQQERDGSSGGDSWGDGGYGRRGDSGRSPWAQGSSGGGSGTSHAPLHIHIALPPGGAGGTASDPQQSQQQQRPRPAVVTAVPIYSSTASTLSALPYLSGSPPLARPAAAAPPLVHRVAVSVAPPQQQLSGGSSSGTTRTGDDA